MRTRHKPLAAAVGTLAALALAAPASAAPTAALTFWTRPYLTGTAVPGRVSTPGTCTTLTQVAKSALNDSTHVVEVYAGPQCTSARPDQPRDLDYLLRAGVSMEFPWPAVSYRVRA